MSRRPGIPAEAATERPEADVERITAGWLLNSTAEDAPSTARIASYLPAWDFFDTRYAALADALFPDPPRPAAPTGLPRELRPSPDGGLGYGDEQWADLRDLLGLSVDTPRNLDPEEYARRVVEYAADRKMSTIGRHVYDAQYRPHGLRILLAAQQSVEYVAAQLLAAGTLTEGSGLMHGVMMERAEWEAGQRQIFDVPGSSPARQPRYSEGMQADADVRVLAFCLAEQERATSLLERGLLRPDDLSTPHPRTVLGAMKQLQERGVPLDWCMVFEELKDLKSFPLTELAQVKEDLQGLAGIRLPGAAQAEHNVLQHVHRMRVRRAAEALCSPICGSGDVVGKLGQARLLLPPAIGSAQALALHARRPAATAPALVPTRSGREPGAPGLHRAA